MSEEQKVMWSETIVDDYVFDLHNINEKTFDVTARSWAISIANQGRGVEKNQLRNFYDKVLELEEKAVNIEDDKFGSNVLPFVKMLKSKVAYAKNRQTAPINRAFELFMNTSIDKITDKVSFMNFKLLFEAVVGFYKKYNNQEKDRYFEDKTLNNQRHNGANQNYGGKKW
jgi:CRISPR-associated protein Csm2